VIRIEHLRKTYGTLVAVDDLSLEVEPGSVFGVLGRNGSSRRRARSPSAATTSVERRRRPRS